MLEYDCEDFNSFYRQKNENNIIKIIKKKNIRKKMIKILINYYYKYNACS